MRDVIGQGLYEPVVGGMSRLDCGAGIGFSIRPDLGSPVTPLEEPWCPTVPQTTANPNMTLVIPGSFPVRVRIIRRGGTPGEIWVYSPESRYEAHFDGLQLLTKYGERWHVRVFESMEDRIVGYAGGAPIRRLLAMTPGAAREAVPIPVGGMPVSGNAPGTAATYLTRPGMRSWEFIFMGVAQVVTVWAHDPANAANDPTSAWIAVDTIDTATEPMAVRAVYMTGGGIALTAPVVGTYVRTFADWEI